MDKPSVQNLIKLVGFQVFKADFKYNPTDQNYDKESLNETLNVELNVGPGFDDTKPNSYIITFILKVNDNSKCLSINVTSVAFFETKDPITNEFKESSFIKANSPAIAFPFLRSFVNTLTTNAGIKPIILPAFNFSSKRDT